MFKMLNRNMEGIKIYSIKKNQDPKNKSNERCTRPLLHKTLLKEIREDLNKWRDIRSWVEKLKFIKMSEDRKY